MGGRSLATRVQGRASPSMEDSLQGFTSPSPSLRVGIQAMSKTSDLDQPTPGCRSQYIRMLMCFPYKSPSSNLWNTNNKPLYVSLQRNCTISGIISLMVIYSVNDLNEDVFLYY